MHDIEKPDLFRSSHLGQSIRVTKKLVLLMPSITTPTGPSEEQISSAQGLVNALQVLEVLTPCLHPDLSTQLFSLLPQLLSCLCSQYTSIRHMAARCLATLAQVHLHTTMQVMNSKFVLLTLGAETLL